jgi:hypothetical protein
MAWGYGAQANCIDIDSEVTVNITACLSPGQNGEFQPNGGFPSDVPEPVGGVDGLPVSLVNSYTCDLLLDSALPAPIARDAYSSPAADPSTELQSGFSNYDGLDTSQLNARSDLCRRVNPITTTGALRNGKILSTVASLYPKIRLFMLSIVRAMLEMGLTLIVQVILTDWCILPQRRSGES